MKLTEIPPLLRKVIVEPLRSFPRRHMYIASALLVIFSVAIVMLPSQDAEAKRNTIALDLNLNPLGAEPANPDADTLPEMLISDPQAQPAPAKSLRWQEYDVRPGDNLSILFKRVGLSATALHRLISQTDQAKSLEKIFPGHKLAFQISADGQLAALRHTESRLKSTTYVRHNQGYETTLTIREPEIRHAFRRAVIDNSLFLAGQKADLPQNIIMELANIFGGVIDFVYDPRKGDSFYLLYEEEFLDGERIGNGAVIAAQYINQGEAHTAFRYVSKEGDVGYYNEEGVSMRKAFLRAPLDFNRISSGFNLRRKHPIHKKIRAHRGVDYAAPRGTPVFAAGNGRIVSSGYSKANGKFVVIKHGPQYTTKYLHLSRRAVKRGQKVKQQQIIGYVGSTGYATGPHLHYEFLVNGVHRNPRTILKKLPKAVAIDKQKMPRFLAQIQGLKTQLASREQAYKLASIDI